MLTTVVSPQGRLRTKWTESLSLDESILLAIAISKLRGVIPTHLPHLTNQQPHYIHRHLSASKKSILARRWREYPLSSFATWSETETWSMIWLFIWAPLEPYYPEYSTQRAYLNLLSSSSRSSIFSMSSRSSSTVFGHGSGSGRSLRLVSRPSGTLPLSQWIYSVVGFETSQSSSRPKVVRNCDPRTRHHWRGITWRTSWRLSSKQLEVKRGTFLYSEKSDSICPAIVSKVSGSAGPRTLAACFHNVPDDDEQWQSLVESLQRTLDFQPSTSCPGRHHHSDTAAHCSLYSSYVFRQWPQASEQTAPFYRTGPATSVVSSNSRTWRCRFTPYSRWKW